MLPKSSSNYIKIVCLLLAEKSLNGDFSRESVLSLEASLSLLFSVTSFNSSNVQQYFTSLTYLEHQRNVNHNNS